jgi:hypothetical protein
LTISILKGDGGMWKENTVEEAAAAAAAAKMAVISVVVAGEGW